jgi:DNA-directed RNA polymerase subunit RPC12/RpoP
MRVVKREEYQIVCSKCRSTLLYVFDDVSYDEYRQTIYVDCPDCSQRMNVEEPSWFLQECLGSE